MWLHMSGMTEWLHFRLIKSQGFLGGSVAKESVCQCRRCWFDPWVGNIPWKRKWQATPVFFAWEIPWTEEPGSLQSMGLQESDTTKLLSPCQESEGLCIDLYLHFQTHTDRYRGTWSLCSSQSTQDFDKKHHKFYINANFHTNLWTQNSTQKETLFLAINFRWEFSYPEEIVMVFSLGFNSSYPYDTFSIIY